MHAEESDAMDGQVNDDQVDDNSKPVSLFAMTLKFYYPYPEILTISAVGCTT